MTREHGGFPPLDERPRRSPPPPAMGPMTAPIMRIERAAQRLYGRPRRRRWPCRLAAGAPPDGGRGPGAGAPPARSARVWRRSRRARRSSPWPTSAGVPEPPLPPILRKIATCESRNTHYDRHGRVLRGTRIRTMSASTRSMRPCGAPVAAQQGYDLYDEQGTSRWPAISWRTTEPYRGGSRRPVGCGNKGQGPWGGAQRQISAMSSRLASESPSMERWVRLRLAWPASCWTSRKEPPASATLRAARVMQVRRPECEEPPMRPSDA